MPTTHTEIGDLPFARPEGSGGGEARRGVRWWASPASLIVASALIAAAYLLVQSLWHGHLTGIDEYDDGVYFGAALELSHGIWPYRDFAFIQPPMITVLLQPFALLARWTGTAVAFETARLAVDLVAVVNVVLIGVLVRHRSRVEIVSATLFMAVYEGTVRSAQTILLEPELVLFCLVALCLLFNRDCLTRSSVRMVASGVFFGLAGATKLWAIVPLAIVAVTIWRKQSNDLVRFLGGVAAGFFGACLPFIAGDPVAFFREIVMTQMARNSGGFDLWHRVTNLTGILGLNTLAQPAAGLILVMVAGTLLLALLWARPVVQRARRVHWSTLDGVAMLCCASVVAMLLNSPTYYYHYAGFAAPFLALSFGLIAGRLHAARLARRKAGVSASHMPPSARLSLVGLAVLLLFLAGTTAAQTLQAPPALQISDSVSDVIPNAGCVLYTNSSVAILDNRFTGDVSGCPTVIDWNGQQRVVDNGLAMTASDLKSAAVQNKMLAWMRSSDAVVTTKASPGWNPLVADYLEDHFHRDAALSRRLSVYVRDGRGASAPSGRDADGPGSLSGRYRESETPGGVRVLVGFGHSDI